MCDPYVTTIQGTRGEAMSSLTPLLQVWMVKCWIKVGAWLVFAMTSHSRLDSTIYKRKTAWINHRSTAIDSTMN